MTLLFAAGKLGVALINDHVQEGVAHVLRGHLAQVLPLGAAFVVTELDLIGLDCAKKRLEVEAPDVIVIDADLRAPIMQETNPITECSDFCYLAWHKIPSPT